MSEPAAQNPDADTDISAIAEENATDGEEQEPMAKRLPGTPVLASLLITVADPTDDVNCGILLERLISAVSC